jgi:glycosyltransferase involved in cell wall biosynthesis
VGAARVSALVEEIPILMIGKILYITYDGLTDPLGQSQILPYLKGLSQQGYQFTILSFEKKGRLQKEKATIDRLTQESGIQWVPLPFTSKPPLLSKFWDAVQMKRTAVALQKKQGFAMVHCRSYIAADVGLYLKKKFGVKFFFDMRGFWADEKKDGSWDVSKPLYKRIYQYYKAKEAQYLQCADFIVSLTHAGKKEMARWPSYNAQVPVDVIPCCADMAHFSLTDGQQKQQSRQRLGVKEDCLVISYLGSVGTWYMLDEMLLFFKQLKETYPDALFLFVTHSDHGMILRRSLELGLQNGDVRLLEASRAEVPFIIKASDINVSFIKPVYSKLSSSPTKLGEVLSMGIPVICNSGVGDVEAIVNGTGSGVVIDGFSKKDFQNAIAAIPALLQKEPLHIRQAVKPIYDLDHGIALYAASYKKVLS